MTGARRVVQIAVAAVADEDRRRSDLIALLSDGTVWKYIPLHYGAHWQKMVLPPGCEADDADRKRENNA